MFLTPCESLNDSKRSFFGVHRHYGSKKVQLVPMLIFCHGETDLNFSCMSLTTTETCFLFEPYADAILGRSQLILFRLLFGQTTKLTLVNLLAFYSKV